MRGLSLCRGCCGAAGWDKAFGVRWGLLDFGRKWHEWFCPVPVDWPMAPAELGFGV